uniref:Eco57I restriction-modification methylase domain-containing protein n=1 Tax=Methanobrevibacter sp. TaxID=66852 RepID=UPI00388D9275
KEFKEEEAKIEFINPMFEALGWDIHNKQGLGPNFKEVVFEESLSVGKETKAPDYSFRLGGQLIYYLEAKKPSINIKDDRSPAFQARRYGWSAKIPIVILTDFEEFAVYETTSKPKEHERASTNRVLYYTCDEYLEKWEEIYSLFSKEAVQKELFQKFVDDNTSKTKKGTQSIDVEFLKDIEKWRLILARNIALRNKDLSLSELNLAVQLIIDRIVFFRMAEDRGIERYQTLYKLSESENIYKQLCEVFKKADLKYNSGLFHFNYTPDYSEFVDNITLNLKIDDGVFKEIFADLYYPKSPYEFSVISPEILGNIYENFLGSIIRLTPSHQAKIEQKPEVKKAGGVFYTPQYIVDYIVDNTVGELIKGKTPNQISKLKILDPACGSGSFLLRAYQKLLDYHLEYYLNLKKAPKEVYYIGKDNVPRLTIREKKRILTNNIYGVDIDVNAVEVTKLSLLLKVLEDENKDVLEAQQKLYQEKVLPNLSSNIKCGNSLIGTDILSREELSHEEVLELNPFDWEVEFPHIFANGGFDAVIGNPPWGASFSDIELDYLKEKNSEIIVRMINSFLYFTYVFSKKLNRNGLFGMIVPDVILYQSSYLLLRQFLMKNFYILKLLNMGMDVFKGVNQPSAIIIFRNNENINSKIIVGNFTNFSKKAPAILEKSNFCTYNQKLLDKIPSNLFITDNIDNYSILEKIENKSDLTIEDILDEDKMQRGASPDYKQAFMINEEIKSKNNLEDSHVKKAIFGGSQIKRHYIEYDDTYLIYTTKKDKFSEIPNICSYIRQFKDNITCKEVKTKKHPLYSLHRPRKDKIFLKDIKIVGVITSDKLIVAVDENKLYATDGVYLFGTIEKFNPYFVTAIFNSKLYTFIYRLYSLENGRILPQVKPAIVKRMPFIDVELNNQKPFIELSNKLNDLKKELQVVKTPQEEKLLKIQIDKVDEQINNMVYELYDLTEDEIKIIEDSLNL